MAKNPISQLLNIELPEVKRANWNCSHDVILTNDVGFDTPVFTDHLMANTHVKLDIDTVAFTNPTIAPLYGRYKVKYIAYWAPDRLYLPEYQEAVQFPADSDVEYPYIETPSASSYLSRYSNAVSSLDFLSGFTLAGLPLRDASNDAIVFIGGSRSGTVPGFGAPFMPKYIPPASLGSYLGLFPANYDNLTFVASLTRANYLKSNACAFLAYWDFYRTYIANQQEATFPVRIQAFNPDVTVGGRNSAIESAVSMSVVSTPVQYISVNRVRLDEFFSSVKAGVKDINSDWEYYMHYSPVFSDKYVYTTYDHGAIPLKPFTGYWSQTMPSTELFDKDRFGVLHNFHYGQPLCPHLPDMFNSWVSNENVELERSTARVNVENGSFTMEQWKLASRMQNFIRKTLFKSGDFTDFIDAHFGVTPSTGITKPMFLGAFVSDIFFDDVISHTQASSTPELANRGQLGSRAAYGRNEQDSKKTNFINFTTKEPGTLQIVQIIQPEVFYFEGRDVQFQTMSSGEEYYPEFDAIGFQDLQAQTLNLVPNTLFDKEARFSFVGREFDTYNIAIAQQPAFIEHMTKVNKLSGMMILPDYYRHYSLARSFNRPYSRGPFFGINFDQLRYPLATAYSSYIYPEEYNETFAINQNLDNFQFYLKFDYLKYQPLLKQFLSFRS